MPPATVDITPRFGALSGTDLTVPGLSGAKDFSQVGVPAGGFTPPAAAATPQVFGSGAMKGLAGALSALGSGSGGGTQMPAASAPGVIPGRAPGSLLDMIRKLQSYRG